METQVLIIGGGATGTGVARDLALRGIEVVLVEQQDINCGASGGNHGLLHSGARYVCTDPEAAVECRDEGEIIKKIAPHCIENTGGLFIAVEGDDENYAGDFPQMCAQSGIPFKKITAGQALALEPSLSGRIIAAYEVEDATIDPFMLSLENISHARQLGATVMRNTRVTGFIRDGKNIVAARLSNLITGEQSTVSALQIVNASGAWAGTVAEMAGASIPMVYSKGTLVITGSRITGRVINRLRQASDADILVPGGTVSIIGTTSVTTKSLNDIHPAVEEVDLIVREGAAMVPELEKTLYIRAYSGVRPLISSRSQESGRSISRGFALLDHSENDLDNLITITGGKLTTYRLMAEKASDLVCSRLKVTRPCSTRTTPLPSTSSGKWTEPGFAPRSWIKKHETDDTLLCECEMVSKSAVDEIVTALQKQGARPTLSAIGLRSRIGKGPCQGGFCGPRVVSHMYDRGYLKGDEGIDNIRQFIRERWKGQRSVAWSKGLIQAELQEAFHCGLYGLENQG